MIQLASSVRWTSGAPAIYLTYEYEKQRSGADMQYRARITVSTVTGASSFGYPIYATVTINGETAGSTTIKAANPSQWSSALTYTTPWITVSNKTTGTTPISFRVYSGTGSTRNQTNTYSMAVDPAATTISAENGTLGTEQTLTLTKYDSTFTATITYTCGTASDTVATKTSASSISFTPSVSLAAQNTTGSSVAITLTATTYTSAGVEVGSTSVVISAAIPDSVKPTASLTLSDKTSYYSTYGAYVQGLSQLLVELTATLAQGAAINGYAITADGKSFSTSEALISPISGSGTLTVTGKVTDTRGRQSNTVTKNITVLPYAAPKIDAVSIVRCNADGTSNNLGSYIKATFTASVSPLNNKNTAKYTLQYKKQTATSYTSVTLSAYTGDYSVNGSHIFAATAGMGYDVQLVVADSIKSTTRAAQAVLGQVAMHFLADKTGGAIGKYAETSNLLDVAWDMRVRGDLTVDGMLNADLDFAIIKKIALALMPVGYIYTSRSSTSPASLFGGTWEQIKDTFILAAGDTYVAGSTGGEATHTLTKAELPHERYGVGQDMSALGVNETWWLTYANKNANGNLASAQLSNTATGGDWAYTEYIGEGQAHNNMPPYLALYMWERTG